MLRRLRWLSVLLLASAALSASDADAAPLRQIAPSVVVFASDGGNYAAWQVHRGGAIVVLDTRTGHRRTIPPGCELVDGQESGEARRVAGQGRFLAECGGHEALLDVRSDKFTPLPEEPVGVNSEWTRVGSRYVQGYTVAEKCVHHGAELKLSEGGPCMRLLDIATGVVSYRPYDEVVNLDKAGAPRECPPLQEATTLGERVPSAYGEGVLALEAHHPPGYVQIVRCRGPKRLVPGREARSFSVGGGLVTWDSGLPPTTSELTRRRAAITSFRISSGQRRSWSIPLLSISGQLSPTSPEPFGYGTHTAQAVFWLAARSLTPARSENQSVGRWSIFWARL
jgi:hypothetical protein